MLLFLRVNHKCLLLLDLSYIILIKLILLIDTYFQKEMSNGNTYNIRYRLLNGLKRLAANGLCNAVYIRNFSRYFIFSGISKILPFSLFLLRFYFIIYLKIAVNKGILYRYMSNNYPTLKEIFIREKRWVRKRTDAKSSLSFAYTLIHLISFKIYRDKRKKEKD